MRVWLVGSYDAVDDRVASTVSKKDEDVADVQIFWLVEYHDVSFVKSVVEWKRGECFLGHVMAFINVCRGFSRGAFKCPPCVKAGGVVHASRYYCDDGVVCA